MENESLKRGSSKDFQILCRLGEGSFSSVYKVKRLSDGQEYAMKKVKLGMLKDKEKENALNEVRILASLADEFIVGYKDSFYEDETQTLNLVMEYASNGDLSKKINEHQKNKTFFAEYEVWRALIHMTKGLKTLHEMNILHRDLKCANIFITASKNGNYYKLGDLNVSKVAKKGLVQTQTGTPYYASPEVWRDEAYDTKSDIWSLGCVIYEMCAQKPPFRASDMEGLFKKVQKGIFDRIPTRYSSELNTVISACLKVNPAQRPTCDNLLNNPFVIRNSGESSVKQIKKEKVELLQTIKLPKNLQQLKSKLPKANYDDKIQEEDECEFKPSRIVSAGAKRPSEIMPNYMMNNNANKLNNQFQSPQFGYQQQQEHQQQQQQQYNHKQLSIQNQLKDLNQAITPPVVSKMQENALPIINQNRNLVGKQQSLQTLSTNQREQILKDKLENKNQMQYGQNYYGNANNNKDSNLRNYLQNQQESNKNNQQKQFDLQNYGNSNKGILNQGQSNASNNNSRIRPQSGITSLSSNKQELDYKKENMYDRYKNAGIFNQQSQQPSINMNYYSNQNSIQNLNAVGQSNTPQVQMSRLNQANSRIRPVSAKEEVGIFNNKQPSLQHVMSNNNGSNKGNYNNDPYQDKLSIKQRQLLGLGNNVNNQYSNKEQYSKEQYTNDLNGVHQNINRIQSAKPTIERAKPNINYNLNPISKLAQGYRYQNPLPNPYPNKNESNQDRNKGNISQAKENAQNIRGVGGSKPSWWG